MLHVIDGHHLIMSANGLESFSLSYTHIILSVPLLGFEIQRQWMFILGRTITWCYNTCHNLFCARIITTFATCGRAIDSAQALSGNETHNVIFFSSAIERYTYHLQPSEFTRFTVQRRPCLARCSGSQHSSAFSPSYFHSLQPVIGAGAIKK